jgi:diaminohydroxyphosphoribosylaminopyrimidine deaminase / 5-amino-6-(5-phosphoribosylamino)uracil reductase
VKEIREKEKAYMQRALELAEKGRGWTYPNPMVGAVIVKDGRIIGEGYHERCGQGHAEVNAFKNATEDVENAELYVTLEPCSHHGKTPPCADLIISKKIKRVVIAALDPNPLVSGRGVKKLEDAGIEVVSGLLAEESITLNEIFMKYIRKKEPFVLLKSAMTLDGKIATVSGESKWISNETSRAHGQKLRNQYMSILVGVQTVIEDDPQLTCRIEGGKNPIRIVADSSLRIPENAKILEDQESASTILAIAKASDSEKKKRLEERGIRIIEFADEKGRVDLKKLFLQLGTEGIDSILIEGGGTLAGSVIQTGMVDRVITYIAPILVGGKNAKSPVAGEGVAELSQALKLEKLEVIPLDGDVALTGRVVKNCSPEL